MTVYLMRHARAGRRSSWSGDDDLRPLTKVGQRQATGLVAEFADTPVTRIISSPYVRCRQTVEPLAQQLRLPVDLADALAEGAPVSEALRLLDKVADEVAVLCTHGDVVDALLDHFARHGVRIGPRRFEKGSVWLLDTVAGTVVEATYLPPPHP